MPPTTTTTRKTPAQRLRRALHGPPAHDDTLRAKNKRLRAKLETLQQEWDTRHQRDLRLGIKISTALDGLKTVWDRRSVSDGGAADGLSAKCYCNTDGTFVATAIPDAIPETHYIRNKLRELMRASEELRGQAYSFDAEYTARMPLMAACASDEEEY